MQKVAIAADGPLVATHFGQCREYLLADVDGGEVKQQVRIASPEHSSCTLPGYLANLGVSCVVAGGMGVRAQQCFAQNGIQVVVGVSGTVNDALNAWLRGALVGGESSCDHSGCGHGHHGG